ncbi:hypothetical protein L3X38_040481 [Prunus dulcis]|uniref:GH18 domain-containing protein n=1 Tax=Prunus dulcis TaxID=3755 RepID=A0AAD4VA73_PRUDU|nr:hypothetical protein L3X38_040481 [Prunus dulcis]
MSRALYRMAPAKLKELKTQLQKLIDKRFIQSSFCHWGAPSPGILGSPIGFPKTIAFGLPFYGYAWNLTDPNQHSIFAPASGIAVPPDGSAGYNLIKAYIAENGAPTVFNSTLVMDYSYTGKTWIGYDDRQSITTKVLYAKRKGLLGSMSIGLFQMQVHLSI